MNRSMGLEAFNLALRFALELAALAAMTYWGWTTHDGFGAWLWAVGLPLFAAVLWGVFRVPGDPGNAPVAVPGILRLLLEVAFFAGAVLLLLAANQPTLALILGALVVFNYVAMYSRVLWLLSQR